jgi:hypothetical protein
MSYKIPSDEEVVMAIQRVIFKHGTISSQRNLKIEVDKELATIEPLYKVGANRVRSLAIRSHFIHTEINYRKNRDNGKGKLSKCPVCGGNIKKIKNLTLQGDTVIIGYNCSECIYTTDKTILEPARYIFSARRL